MKQERITVELPDWSINLWINYTIFKRRYDLFRFDIKPRGPWITFRRHDIKHFQHFNTGFYNMKVFKSKNYFFCYTHDL